MRDDWSSLIDTVLYEYSLNHTVYRKITVEIIEAAEETAEAL